MSGIRSAMFSVCVVVMSMVCAPVGYAVPIADFSGQIQDWFVGDDAGTAVLSFAGVTSGGLQSEYAANGGTGSLSLSFIGPPAVGIDRTPTAYNQTVMGNLQLTEAEFAFVDASWTLSVLDSVSGNEAQFQIRLDSFIVRDVWNTSTNRGNSQAFINADVDYSELLAYFNNISELDFDIGWDQGFGDFVFSLQATNLVASPFGGVGILSDILINDGVITGGSATSGSFSAGTNIPEPTTMALLGAGIASLVASRRRKAA